jgi:hypothetical protein
MADVGAFPTDLQLTYLSTHTRVRISQFQCRPLFQDVKVRKATLRPVSGAAHIDASLCRTVSLQICFVNPRPFWNNHA